MSDIARHLLVEGSDDKHVLLAIVNAHQVPEAFDIKVSDGVEKLMESVSVYLKSSVLTRLAVIVDADEDIIRRWSQIRGRLESAGCQNLPQAPEPEGLVVTTPDNIVVGVWIMPDNKLPGRLEDFVAFLVPYGDDLLPLIDRFLDDLPTAARRFPEERRTKARIHTWLALQNEPGKPLGQAITARYLNARHTSVLPFVSWIRRALVD